MMKFDSGAANVGVPSKLVFEEGKYTPEAPRFVWGVSGRSWKRQARDISIMHNDVIISIDTAFEHNKFLLGYEWFKHFEININLEKNAPFTVKPLSRK